MAETLPSLGEPADESAWRALVAAGLKGGSFERLTSQTADGLPIAPLYREGDCPTATDVSGFPGAAPFVRGASTGSWAIRQIFAHPDPLRTNRDIRTDLEGGVASIELAIDPEGMNGVAIRDGADLDLALAGVIVEAAPIALDARAHGLWAAKLLAAKFKGAGVDVAFNIDPIGALMRVGGMGSGDIAEAAIFSVRMREIMPAARTLRIDARPVHEAGGTEAQELAVAWAVGIAYLRALLEAGLTIENAGASMLFTLSVGTDVLIETAKLRALRLGWARIMEASGAAPPHRAAQVQAVTSRRMMTRFDAWTNIVRVTSAAFAAAMGGADAITTLPLTDALGLPTPFARRVARNTQHVLLEESHLGHVADPAGGSWFVEDMTRKLAEAAWAKMQAIEAQGGIVEALKGAGLQRDIAEARTRRQKAFATRRETITGLTDFPMLGAEGPTIETSSFEPIKAFSHMTLDLEAEPMAPIRWAAPFETLRDRACGAFVFFANLGPLAEFSPRSNFARNLLAAGGVDAIGPETEYSSVDELAAAYRKCGASVAVICGADAHNAREGVIAAQALKRAGCSWLLLAGKPTEDSAFRAVGVDQFVFAGQDALVALETVHNALGGKP